MLFYDFEVFKYDWLVVIKNALNNRVTVICNDTDALYDFYTKNKDNIWIGYNSRHYDQFILKCIIAGLEPYKMNDHIINQGQHGATFSSLIRGIQLFNYDVMNSFHGLKQLEGFMGESIKETSVPFDIDRKLTAAELQEVIQYCKHDVEQTIKVFEATAQEFESQLSLLKAFKLPLAFVTKTKAQLSAKILGASSKAHNDEFNITIADTIRLNKYRSIMEWYENPLNLDYDSKLEIDVAGVPHVFAWGGLHGAVSKYGGKGIFVNMDVASFYPSLMIEYGFASRNISDPNKYQEIYKSRLELKAAKNPMQQPYKIVLNATYGAMKDRHNPLYDPLQANNVCINGQLMLLDLIEKLEPHCQIIQSNTDGILVRIESMDDLPTIKAVAGEWESRTRMILEFDLYAGVYQKDVNNYIIVDQEGKYKSKGAYVKKLNPLDYDLPIVNKAVVENLTKGVPVEQTINECNELIQFQKIVKVSSKYQYGLYGNTKLNERVLRVFASRSDNDQGVFKVKNSERVEKIANTPPRCFILNENIKGAKVPRKLDKTYYIGIANKRIQDFIGGK
ncbi:MAG: hypothetical protein K0S71_589 [Clostridia bacterium]|jgi:hypothetical protein|nr:hypothetical protein [Clostridia bacterium]